MGQQLKPVVKIVVNGTSADPRFGSDGAGAGARKPPGDYHPVGGIEDVIADGFHLAAGGLLDMCRERPRHRGGAR